MCETHTTTPQSSKKSACNQWGMEILQTNVLFLLVVYNSFFADSINRVYMIIVASYVVDKNGHDNTMNVCDTVSTLPSLIIII